MASRFAVSDADIDLEVQEETVDGKIILFVFFVSLSLRPFLGGVSPSAPSPAPVPEIKIDSVDSPSPSQKSSEKNKIANELTVTSENNLALYEV